MASSRSAAAVMLTGAAGQPAWGRRRGAGGSLGQAGISSLPTRALHLLNTCTFGVGLHREQSWDWPRYVACLSRMVRKSACVGWIWTQ